MALPAMGVELEMSKFVRNLHEMVSDDANASAVGFSPDGLSLELRDTEHLSQVVLPKYFKHGNISSLTRQLNNYGFKTNPPRTNAQVSQSFTHPFFCRGKVELYGHVKRRAAPPSSSGSSSSLLSLSPSSAAAAAASASSTPGSRVDEDKKLRMDHHHQQQQQPVLINSPMLQAQAMMHQKPSYQQLLELNSRLQQQNSLLEDRVRQLEDTMRTRSPPIGVQPQFLMPSPSHQQQLQHQQQQQLQHQQQQLQHQQHLQQQHLQQQQQQQQLQYNRASVGGRMSAEQQQQPPSRLFPNMMQQVASAAAVPAPPPPPASRQQVLGFGGIRSSGEQARHLFGEDGSGSLDDDDVVTLKNMFLRTSMDEDQGL